MEMKRRGQARMGWADSGEGNNLERPGLEQDQSWTESPRMTPRGSFHADVTSSKSNNDKNNAGSLSHGLLRRLKVFS